jgi:flagellar basal-body rod protein FlgB
MDLTKINLFQMMTKRMAYLTERQTVLAQNVANADTPGYRPVDLKPQDFRAELAKASGRLQPVTTAPQHLAGLPTGPTHGRVEAAKQPSDRALSGNAVNLEQELMKVSQTAGDYNMVTSLMRKQLGLLKTALGRQG